MDPALKSLLQRIADDSEASKMLWEALVPNMNLVRELELQLKVSKDSDAAPPPPHPEAKGRD